MNPEKEKGSVLVLTIIAVLILSVMVTGLLNVGTTEIYTTQNFHLKKSAYYTAVQGVEEIRADIYNNPDAESVKALVKMPPTQAYSGSGGFLRFYVTGSLKDLENILAGIDADGVPLEQFMGFDAPPPPALSLGGGTGVESIIWKVQVTAKIDANKRTTYSEVLSGIYSVVTTSY